MHSEVMHSTDTMPRTARLRYSLVFFLISVWLFYNAIGNINFWQGISITILGSQFFILAWAYRWNGANIFGKNRTGRFFTLTTLATAPFLIICWSTWGIWRILFCRRPYTEIDDQIILGVFPFFHQIPDDVFCIIDLTAEFPRCNFRNGVRYFGLPTLDGTSPSAKDSLEVIEQISTTRQKTYVYCANGSGRSAAFVAAILLRKHPEWSIPDAIARLKSKRPEVAPNVDQVLYLELMQKEMTAANVG